MSVQQIFFLILLAVVAFLAYRLYGRLVGNIRIGKSYSGAPDPARRWRNLLLIALGQKKMFKNLIPAVLHLFIYIAFLLTQIELIEILIDGVFGWHRFFAGYLGILYTGIISLIEVLSVLALVGTVIFLWRRNILKVKRFENPEMKGWPRRDANLILIGEILLIVGIFSMNGADIMLQDNGVEHYQDTGDFLISAHLGPVIFSGLDTSTLIFLERSGWWLHILVVFGFFLYLPLSKHLHILLAFPNTYFARQSSPGRMENMEEIMQEVRSMMGLTSETSDGPSSEIPEFGASDVKDLSWKSLLDAYACTECGRCTAACPANITGKKLSPRKIMMDVRDRMEEVGAKIRTGDPKWIDEVKGDGKQPLNRDNFSDGRSLFDYITKEELHACTTCNACVEACPVLINPLEIILEMRRYEILTLGTGPQDWLPMFTSLENSGSVWQVSSERDSWTKNYN